MINSLLTLYSQKFPFEKFYDNLLYNISTYPKYHIDSKTFLLGFSSANLVTQDIPNILTQVGDIRVDLPVWFGNADTKKKIVVIGLEPRDSDKTGHLNIERINNYVFASPFALERPQGPYYAAFKNLMNSNKIFTYFTDIVKTYEVNNINDKIKDDAFARQTFLKKATANKAFLLNELEIINPSKVIALGDKSFFFLTQLLGNKYDVLKVRHPSQGGSTIARKTLDLMLMDLN